MSKNKLTFESENLVVDWIGFNIQGLVNQKGVETIANYLFRNFGFNSTFAIGLDGKEKVLVNNPNNKYHAYLRAYRYSDIYWDGIKIDFSGQNGHHFYKLIVMNQVNWEIFSYNRSLTLSRLDLCYSRTKANFDINIKTFLQKCFYKVSENKAIKNFSLQQNYSSWILKIGKRGSPNHYRVYDNQTHIRFELEQRGFKIKSIQKYLFESQIDTFEDSMTETFFNYSKKVLAIDENYIDWLIDYHRRYNLIKKLLVTGYFDKKSADLELTDIVKKKHFFKLLQFLAFSRTQDINIKTFWDQSYCIVKFKITDFMNFIKIKNKNQYQREKLIQFFGELQTMKPFIKVITNQRFHSSVLFPVIKATKKFEEYGVWIMEIAILQELYFFNYKFFLPDYFLTYQKNFELEVKLHFIQTYSSQSLIKTFYVNKILDQYKNNNNQKKAQIKQIILESFRQALTNRIIQDHCQVGFKNKKRKSQLIKIRKLNNLIISQACVINFYELVF